MTPATSAPVIGYVRVSTDDQATDGASLDAQRAAITNECSRRGWRLVEIHEDTASGKTTARRPGLAGALEHLESGEPDAPSAIIVARLDRLTRSVADGARLFERAKSAGWGIVALDLGVDTTTPAGELVANVMVAVGQWERRVISERTRSALAQRKLEGVRLGRPPSTEHKDPAKAAHAQKALARLRELRSQGLSYAKCAAALNEEGIPGMQGGRWWDRSARLVLLNYDSEGDTP